MIIIATMDCTLLDMHLRFFVLSIFAPVRSYFFHVEENKEAATTKKKTHALSAPGAQHLVNY